MDKAVKMGKTSATGSLQLFVGKIASTLVLAIGTIIVGIFINDWELGLYTIALIPSLTFLLFQDWGINSALTKYCANYRATNRQAELRSIILSGLTFEAMTGVILTLFSLLTANFVALTIFGNSDSAFLISLSSVTIFSAAMYNGAVSVFVGFEKMKLSTIVMIISSTIQGFLSALLVYLGFGAVGAIVGLVVSSVTSGVAALALLYFVILKKLPSGSIDKEILFQNLKMMLHYGLPISVSTIMGGLSPQITSILMASIIDEAIIGNYRIATNFSVFLAFFIFPIQTVMFPAFSKLNPSNDKRLLKMVFESSVKYLSLLLVPATIAIMVLSAPMINTIYGNKWPFAPFFLTLYVSGNLLVLLGNVILNQLLYATGDTKIVMYLHIFGTCITIPLGFLLIPSLGITGLILSSFGGIPGIIIGIYWAWTHYETKANFRNSGKILIASTIAGISTYLFLNIFDSAAWIMLTIGAILFLIVYVFSISLVGAINQTDLDNLRVMFSGLGPFSKLLTTLLVFIEKALRIKEKLSRT